MKKNKKPSLLRKIIEIHHEEAMQKKAMRIIAKQEWSIEFLCWLCAKAARLANSPIEISIESPSKQRVTIRSVDIMKEAAYDESILDRLDDTAAVEDYIKRHSTRGGR